MEPPIQAKELRKQLVWLTLACLSNNLGQKRIDWQGGKKFLSKALENGRGFNRIVSVASKFRAHYARKVVMEPPFMRSCIRHWCAYMLWPLNGYKNWNCWCQQSLCCLGSSRGLGSWCSPEKKKGVVYEVECNECEGVYVGETGKTLKKRISEHKQAVKWVTTSLNGIAVHVNEQGPYHQLGGSQC